MTNLQRVLEQAHRAPFKTQSNFSRKYAVAVAMAASDGFITTKVAIGLYTDEWALTPSGLSHLYTLKGFEQ